LNKVKVAVGLLFVVGVIAAFAGQSLAYPPMLAKARKFGAKDCTFCHVEPEGGPPWNERGKWLIAEKERRKAEAVDVDWLADFKAGTSKGKNDESKTPAGRTSAASSDEQELISLLNELIEAAKKRDASVFAHVIADDFSEINADGQVFTKAQVLGALADLALESYVVSEVTTRVLGDAAVLTFHQTSKGTFQGQSIGGEYRETVVWAKREGRWHMVAAHISRIAARPPGSTNEG